MRSSIRLSFAVPLALALFGCPGDDTTTTTSGASSTGSTGAADSTTAVPGTSSTTAVGTDSTGSSTTTDASTSSTTAMDTTVGMATDSSGGSSTGPGACPPADGASIGVDCKPGTCPECYTCQPFEGIVFQQQCQILCESVADCPPGLECTMVVDKTGMPWQQCG